MPSGPFPETRLYARRPRSRPIILDWSRARLSECDIPFVERTTKGPAPHEEERATTSNDRPILKKTSTVARPAPCGRSLVSELQLGRQPQVPRLQDVERLSQVGAVGDVLALDIRRIDDVEQGEMSGQLIPANPEDLSSSGPVGLALVGLLAGSYQIEDVGGQRLVGRTILPDGTGRGSWRRSPSWARYSTREQRLAGIALERQVRLDAPPGQRGTSRRP